MSKFDRLFRVAKDESAILDDVVPAKPSIRSSGVHSGSSPAVGEIKKGITKSPSLKQVKVLSEVETHDDNKVSGKRQHPDYVGLTTYVRRDIHRRVKIALLVEGQNRELSQLVDSLLADWLQSQANN